MCPRISVSYPTNRSSNNCSWILWPNGMFSPVHHAAPLASLDLIPNPSTLLACREMQRILCYHPAPETQQSQQLAPKYQHRTPSTVIRILTSVQQTSTTGPPICFICFGIVLPDCSTSQQRTLESQLPAIRKFCCNVAGLNSIAETVSSGGEATSKSFIGFIGAATVCATAPKAGAAPNVDAPNMFTA